MIVICPNCGTRYKLPDDIALAGKRMRCAECEHRWMIEAEAPVEVLSEEEELARAQDAIRTPPVPEPVPEPEPEPAAPEPVHAEPEEEETPRRSWLGWAVVLVVATALGLLAASIWLERLDPARVPVIGGSLAGLKPGPSALMITATGQLSTLPSGGLLLDVSGKVRNTGSGAQVMGPLKATLAGPSGVVRRWTITVPATQLPPGSTAPFASTLTDVPAGATRLRITSGS